MSDYEKQLETENEELKHRLSISEKKAIERDAVVTILCAMLRGCSSFSYDGKNKNISIDGIPSVTLTSHELSDEHREALMEILRGIESRRNKFYNNALSEFGRIISQIDIKKELMEMEMLAKQVGYGSSEFQKIKIDYSKPDVELMQRIIENYE